MHAERNGYAFDTPSRDYTIALMNIMDWKSGLVGFFPGVIVGGAFIMAAQTFTGRDVAPVQTPVASAEANTKAISNTQTLIVVDQPAGRAVVVKQATLDATSWIAIRDLQADGSVGNILGAVRRDAGAHNDVIIDLLRSTEPEKKYAAVLFTDNGDGTFNSKSDAPYMDTSEVFKTIFSVTVPRSPGGR